MRTIKEILELVLQEFEQYPHDGLCNTATHIFSQGEITLCECDKFRKYLRKTTGSTKVYIWRPPYEKPERLNWLKEHIKLNS